jgi:hypothetical protein
MRIIVLSHWKAAFVIYSNKLLNIDQARIISWLFFPKYKRGQRISFRGNPVPGYSSNKIDSKSVRDRLLTNFHVFFQSHYPVRPHLPSFFSAFLLSSSGCNLNRKTFTESWTENFCFGTSQIICHGKGKKWSHVLGINLREKAQNVQIWRNFISL